MVCLVCGLCGVVRPLSMGIVFNLMLRSSLSAKREGSVMHYFVYDCNNQIVGNPKGYKTFRGAARVEKNHKGALWRRFFEYKDNGGTSNTVSRIEQGKD